MAALLASEATKGFVDTGSHVVHDDAEHGNGATILTHAELKTWGDWDLTNHHVCYTYLTLFQMNA